MKSIQTIYTSLKVNNEYELCEVYEEECKTKIEQALLRNRISYYLHFPKPKLFSGHRYVCVFCVNETCVDAAEEIVNTICADNGYEVKFLVRKNPVQYL